MIYNIDQNTINSNQLISMILAGSGIVIDRVDDCSIQISATGGSSSVGTQYLFRNGESAVVNSFVEYFLKEFFELKNGSTFTINSQGRLVCEGGIVNDGHIINDGEIIN
jgi:hypothetical protein